MASLREAQSADILAGIVYITNEVAWRLLLESRSQAGGRKCPYGVDGRGGWWNRGKGLGEIHRGARTEALRAGVPDVAPLLSGAG